MISARGKRLRASEHGQGAAALDVGADALQVVADAVGQILEVLQHDQVERGELLLEQLARGERDERHLVVGDQGDIVLGAQDEKRDQIDVGVGLQHLAQGADVPGRLPRHLQDADLVAQHPHHEGARVVAGDRLSADVRHRDLVDVAPDARRGDLEGDPHLVVARWQLHHLLTQRLAVGGQGDRDLLRGQAGGLDDGVDAHHGAHEGELVGQHALDREVAQARARRPHGVDAGLEPSQEVLGVFVEATGGGAVAYHDDAGEVAAIVAAAHVL
ncbi:MAG: hypothetical protein IPI49_21940 [Myxococcales bacterium]|nr:hypothetical protein [Myxococcales bacterium]